MTGIAGRMCRIAGCGAPRHRLLIVHAQVRVMLTEEKRCSADRIAGMTPASRAMSRHCDKAEGGDMGAKGSRTHASWV